MTQTYDDKLLPEAKRVYGAGKIPYKFCPYCGAKNEGPVDECTKCGKDISWIRIPQPTARTETPEEKPRLLPKQKDPFRRRNIVILVILALLVITAVTIYLISRNGGSSSSVVEFYAMALMPLAGGLVAGPQVPGTGAALKVPAGRTGGCSVPGCTGNRVEGVPGGPDGFRPRSPEVPAGPNPG